MRRLIDGHAIHERREIGAMIEVVPAHQVLVGLPFAAVQRHDESRHRLHQLTWSIGRGQLKLLIRHDAFARGIGGAEQTEALGSHRDLVHLGAGGIGLAHHLRTECTPRPRHRNTHRIESACPAKNSRARNAEFPG
jgi:hypothetical protein